MSDERNPRARTPAAPAEPDGADEAAEPVPALPNLGPRVQSRWLAMRDGVRIAIDVILPSDAQPDRSLPAVMIMTRYWRSFRLRIPGPRGRPPMGPDFGLVEALLRHGFAVVVVDARGSGASDGVWTHPWSDAEIEDYGEVADWVAGQPWSSGRVGAAGLSYAGTSALLLGATGRAQVRAIVASNIEYDVFTDIVAPGGIRNRAFVRAWSHAIRLLDRDRPPSFFGTMGRLLVAGVRPVDEDAGRRGLRRILARRLNPSVGASLAHALARDDRYGDQEVTVEALGIPCWVEALRAGSPPTQLWASWLDGATADAALRMWATLPSIRELRITATSHTGEDGADPFAEGSPPQPSMPERLSEVAHFLDGRLRSDDASPDERRIHYVTMGEQPAWHTTTAWPPPGVAGQELFIARGGRLQWEQGHDVGSVIVPLDRRASTGRCNRWHTGLARPVRYGDRRRADRLLATWTGDPLPAPLAITGHPVAILAIRAPAEDVALFVYLELIEPSGEVHYLTEGILRAAHRGRRPEREPTFRRRDLHPLEPNVRTELRIPFQPTSVLVPAGWRLRLAVAGADRDTFATLAGQPQEITLEFGGPAASRLLVPIVE